jgi:hypothetical protein
MLQISEISSVTLSDGKVSKEDYKEEGIVSPWTYLEHPIRTRAFGMDRPLRNLLTIKVRQSFNDAMSI